MVTREDIYGNMTNEEKMKAMLEPHHHGRVRTVERPNLQPRRCAITGRHQDRYFIDLGIDTGDFMGQVYICADIAENIAKLAGFVPRQELEDAYNSNMELAGLALEALAAYEKVKETLDGLVQLDSNSSSDNLSERIRTLATEATEQGNNENVVEDSGAGTSEDTRPDQQSSKQGLADLPSFSRSSHPAI